MSNLQSLHNQNEVLRFQVVEKETTIKTLEQSYHTIKTQYSELHNKYKETIRENDLAKLQISHKWDEVRENDKKTLKNINTKSKEVLNHLDGLHFTLAEFHQYLLGKDDKDQQKHFEGVLSKARDVREVDKIQNLCMAYNQAVSMNNKKQEKIIESLK